MSSSEEECAGSYLCLDDGIIKSVYYLNLQTGVRKRAVPQGFEREKLSSGHLRFVYRGKCLRCPRREYAPVFLSMQEQSLGFSMNLCEDCLAASVDGKIRGNGDKVYLVNEAVPQTAFIDLKGRFYNEHRERELLMRALYAKFYVLMQGKRERDKKRMPICKLAAMQAGVTEGLYASWGLDNDCFNEYYGELDGDNKPQGKGVMFYSDGSVYVGSFKHGERFTDVKSDVKGFWTRKDGSAYDGTWMNDEKHGYGTQTYPDGSTYEGEFANGVEHGFGKRIYPDGSRYEGRFRLGRRDGQGILISVDGTTEKRRFRDIGLPWIDKNPPLVQMQMETVNHELFNPLSLKLIALNVVANSMIKSRFILTSKKIFTKLGTHIKPVIANAFFEAIEASSSKQNCSPRLVAIGANFAFQYLETLDIRYIKLKEIDVDTVIYFSAANTILKSLSLVGVKLISSSIEIICKQLHSKNWISLESLDLSYNMMDIKSLTSLCMALMNMTTLKILKLACCNVRPNGAHVIGTLIQTNKSITFLDLAYNYIEGNGAESLCLFLYNNTTLKSLNLRQNSLSHKGGDAFSNLLLKNKTLEFLCLADNRIGVDIMTLIVGRLSSANVMDVANAVCYKELSMNPWYKLGRFVKWNPTTNVEITKKRNERKKKLQEEMEKKLQLESMDEESEEINQTNDEEKV